MPRVSRSIICAAIALLAGCGSGEDMKLGAGGSGGEDQTGGTGGDGGMRSDGAAGATSDAAVDRIAAEGGLVGGVIGGVSDGGSATEPPPLTMFTPSVDVLGGTRIKGLYVRSAAGARQRWGLWDSTLNVPCHVARAEDGKFRCLPIPPNTADLGVSEISYSDMGCTEPLLPAEAACQGRFGFRTVTMNGLGHRVVHRLGAARQVTTVYRQGTNGCEMVTTTAPRMYFTLGAVVPPTSFVERLTNRLDGPASQRIRLIYYNFADNAKARTPLLWDEDLDVDCVVQRSADGRMRCLPSATAAISDVTFTDDKCSRQAAFFGINEMQPKFASRVDGSGCMARTRVHAIGPKATATFRLMNERCVPLAVSTTLTYHELGAEAAASTFSPFRKGILTFGRLEEHHYVNEEGVSVHDYLWDTQLNIRCDFHRMQGGRRCAPYLVGLSFADMGCTTRVAVPVAAPCGSSATVGGFVSRQAGPWCSLQVEVATLREPAMLGMPARVFRPNAAGVCSALNTTATYHGLGAAVDPGMFEAGVEGMD